MAHVDPRLGLLPSVLDRLTAAETGHGYNIAQLLEAVRRDLEDLLNTRRTVDVPADDYPETAGSIVNYGIPDLPSLQISSAQQCEDVCPILVEIINLFEPRLRDVQVTLLKGDAKDRVVRFHIEARLAVEPTPAVGFETVLELSTGHAEVRPSES